MALEHGQVEQKYCCRRLILIAGKFMEAVCEQHAGRGGKDVQLSINQRLKIVVEAVNRGLK